MHEIRYLTFSGRFGQKRVYDECNKVHKHCCEYHNRLDKLRFPLGQKVLKNRTEAEQYIEQHDNGWYDQIAVRFKDEQRHIRWMAKIEYHV